MATFIFIVSRRADTSVANANHDAVQLAAEQKFLTAGSSPSTSSPSARGAICGDFDRGGDLHALLTSNNGPAHR